MVDRIVNALMAKIKASILSMIKKSLESLNDYISIKKNNYEYN